MKVVIDTRFVFGNLLLRTSQHDPGGLEGDIYYWKGIILQVFTDERYQTLQNGLNYSNK